LPSASVQIQLIAGLQVFDKPVRFSFRGKNGVIEERAISRPLLTFFRELSESLREEHVGIWPREWFGGFGRQPLIGDPANDGVL
jgi:hypothetical protein